MSSVNKAIILGYLGADPDLRYLSSGRAVCEIRVATNEKWIKEGQSQEKTEWHRLVAWDKTAELCAEYLKKGAQAYFEGRIQTRSWDDGKGSKRYTTEIVVSNVTFLGSSKVQAPEAPPSAPDQKPVDVVSTGPVGEPLKKEEPRQASSDDDIPF